MGATGIFSIYFGVDRMGVAQDRPGFLDISRGGHGFYPFQGAAYDATVRYELVLFPVFLLLSRLMAGRPKLPGLWPASASPPRFSISIDTPLGSGWPSTSLPIYSYELSCVDLFPLRRYLDRCLRRAKHTRPKDLLLNR